MERVSPNPASSGEPAVDAEAALSRAPPVPWSSVEAFCFHHAHVATHRHIVTRPHAPPGGRSQISFGGDDAFVAPAPHRPDTAAFAAKEREQAGNDIFGAEPAPSLAVAESAAAFVAPEAPPPAEIAATEVEIRAMMIAELRQLCRAHGLSPAGAKGTLVDRLVDAIASGSIRVMVANRGASGVVADVNNYGRAEGQNVGNFMTGRNSSRVLAPPGGVSSFSLGGYGSEQHNTVRM